MLAPPGQELPTKDLIAAGRAGKGGLEQAAGMPDLIKAAATDQPLWAVAKVTDTYRQLPLLAGFDTVSVVGRQNGSTIRLEATGRGTDAGKVAASVQALGKEHKSSLDWMKGVSPVMPPLQRVTRFLESVKTAVDGTNATATATFEGPVTRVIVFMNFPYATANPVDEDKPLPPPKQPEEAPLNPQPQFRR
jgi:hypothetical protein